MTWAKMSQHAPCSTATGGQGVEKMPLTALHPPPPPCSYASLVTGVCPWGALLMLFRATCRRQAKQWPGNKAPTPASSMPRLAPCHGRARCGRAKPKAARRPWQQGASPIHLLSNRWPSCRWLTARTTSRPGVGRVSLSQRVAVITVILFQSRYSRRKCLRRRRQRANRVRPSCEAATCLSPRHEASCGRPRLARPLFSHATSRRRGAWSLARRATLLMPVLASSVSSRPVLSCRCFSRARTRQWRRPVSWPATPWLPTCLAQPAACSHPRPWPDARPPWRAAGRLHGRCIIHLCGAARQAPPLCVPAEPRERVAWPRGIDGRTWVALRGLFPRPGPGGRERRGNRGLHAYMPHGTRVHEHE